MRILGFESFSKTIKWLLRDFSLTSILRVLRYYSKKKFGFLDYKKTFFVLFNFKNKKIKMLLRENNDDFAIVREVFLLNAYKSPFKEVKTIVDGGSHIGASAIYFSLMYPDCKIICVEPSKENSMLLKQNLKLNGIKSDVINKCISDKRKTITFHYNKKNPAYSGISKDGKEKIKTTTLNQIIKNSGEREIDLLKLDIEGEEIKIIKKLNKNIIKRVILETHFDKYPLKTNLMKIILSRGFEVLPKMNHWKKLNKNIEYPFMIFKRK